MLYHSFPRSRDKNPQDKGLRILKNILKYGFLLAPEIRKYPKLDEEETGEYSLIQCRFCMTAIDNVRTFKKHIKGFGNIHIEFTGKSAYEMGALPVMYVPKAEQVGSDKVDVHSLWHLASTFVHRIDDFKSITSKLEQFTEAVDNFANKKEITVSLNNGYTKDINVAQLRDILEFILEGVVDINKTKDRKKAEFSQMLGAVQGLCSLFYFTDYLDEKNKYKYLHYYRQQEWRIVQGISINGKIQDRKLTLCEKLSIAAVDRSFFCKELDFNFDTRRYRIIDLCRLLPEINGKPVQDFINRIYVPPDIHKKALVIAEKNNFPVGKIISYTKIGEIIYRNKSKEKQT